MNLEEKATEYTEKHKASIPFGEHHNVIADFINGYKECLSDLLDFLKANPKADSKQITEYLNSL